MKERYSQGSQDFSENFEENSHDDSEASLVAFLRQNKPIAPPPVPNFEQQLFAEISKYPQRSTRRNFKRWLPWALLIPIAIATGITFNLVNNRSQLQIASNPSLNQMSESEQAAIEQSLISSWNVTDDVVLQTTNAATTSTDTQLLNDLSPLEYE
ncbi:MAG: hypothetical protein DCF19_12450 [Pseudanabaena frigida]|uniref:Uncharacterized protein n=1 Tax=Pseudanabaena frigida TaxID=945775 RepID=A0A2W4W5M7_9CYAN|nr:MAG: hypothetical protein DCF19_12450 [Pseudanabaena frigida]